MSRFLIGNNNFGTNLSDYDNEWIEFIFPTWGELFRCEMLEEEVEYNNDKCSIKDVRFLSRIISRSLISDIQILFSDTIIDGGELELWLSSNRDRLLDSNIANMFNNNIDVVMSKLKSFMVSKNGKDLAYCYYILEILDRFYNNNFKLDSIKTYNKAIIDEIIKSPSQEHVDMVKDLLVSLESRKDEFKNPVDDDILNKLDNFIYSLCRVEILKEEGVVK